MPGTEFGVILKVSTRSLIDGTLAKPVSHATSQKPSDSMRIVSLYLGVPAALAMMAVSMGCNWLYLSGFGRTTLVIVLLSAASIAIS
jgi:hypothetical protein